MDEILPLHSVRLDPERCVGCTTCIKKCPTGAIRVRKGQAHILDERCIDCGECIRTCPHGAKKAVSDPLEITTSFRYKIALPAPTLYAQFSEEYSIEHILGALISLGFDEVFEVAEAAELVTEATKVFLSSLPQTGRKGLSSPLISSACPAVVRLIQLRFPSLIPNLAPLIPPMELAARIAKNYLHPGETGVGVFFISPCAAKVTTVRAPLGYSASSLDGVIGIKDIYLPLRGALGKGGSYPSRANAIGLEWARTEGEAEALGDRRSIAVDGIGAVIGVLEALENGNLENVAYIEALACPAGCLGGPLTVENPYIARSRLNNRALHELGSDRRDKRRLLPRISDEVFAWSSPVKARQALALDPDMLKAMIMMEEMDQIAATLPHLDCGSCGAPSCQALAEDIVRGRALETDCVFKLRENVRDLAGKLLALEELKPPGLDREP